MGSCHKEPGRSLCQPFGPGSCLLRHRVQTHYLPACYAAISGPASEEDIACPFTTAIQPVHPQKQYGPINVYPHITSMSCSLLHPYEVFTYHLLLWLSVNICWPGCYQKYTLALEKELKWFTLNIRDLLEEQLHRAEGAPCSTCKNRTLEAVMFVKEANWTQG